MLEGRLIIDPSGRSAEVQDPETGEVLAEGFLHIHPGSQEIAGPAIASALQFSGALTPAGEARVAA